VDVFVHGFVFADTCMAMSGCLNLSNSTCKDCVSGQVGCTEVQCGQQGRCLGSLIGLKSVNSTHECSKECKTENKCLWYTFDSLNNVSDVQLSNTVNS
jgi:hypothetical protein